MDSYIKMCDCAEIRSQCKFNERDLFDVQEVRAYYNIFYDEGLHYIGEPIWFCCDDVGVISKDNFIPHYSCSGEDIHTFKQWVWLPRQEDLQAMISKRGLQTLCNLLYEFSCSQEGHGITISGTMTELWLAFVMHELYQKEWRNGKWRLENVSEKL